MLRLLFIALLVTSYDEATLTNWTLTDPGPPWMNVSDTGTANMTVSVTIGPGKTPIETTMGGLACVQFFGNTVGGNFSNGIYSPSNTNGVQSFQAEYKESLSVKASFFPTNLGSDGDFGSIVVKRLEVWPLPGPAAQDAVVIDLLNTNDGQWVVGLASSNTVLNAVAESTHKFTLNNWQTVGFSYDGTTIRTYKDGVATVTLAMVGNVFYGNHAPWSIGANSSNTSGGTGASNAVHGCIRHVQVSNLIQPASWFVN
jgi:hypothetical protein